MGRGNSDELQEQVDKTYGQLLLLSNKQLRNTTMDDIEAQEE